MNSETINLKDVRLSFPHVFKPTTYGTNENSLPKYEATFILDKVKHKDTIELIKKNIDKLVKEDLKISKLKPELVCLKDGEFSEFEAYQNSYYIKAKSNADRKPLVINRLCERIDAEDGKIYGGCYVNAQITLWSQDNDFGKRINCNLRGIQFLRDGEPFGDNSRARPEDFEVINDDEVECDDDLDSPFN